MSENQDLSKQFADAFADKAKVGVDVATPFAAAEGISKTAITEAADSEVQAHQDIIDYDRAKTELGMIGASSAVVEAGNGVLDVLKSGVNWFAKKLEGRGSKLLTRSEKQQKNAKAVEEARKAMETKQSMQQMENARLNEVAPGLKASRGIWGETGGRVLEWAGVKVREITVKPYSELCSATNHFEATVLNTGADVLKDSAEWVTEIAKGVSTKVQEQISTRKTAKATEVSQLEAAKDQSEKYAQFTKEVKTKVEDADYLMPDAAAKSRTIDQAGGDSRQHTALNEVTNEWTGRVAGTN